MGEALDMRLGRPPARKGVREERMVVVCRRRVMLAGAVPCEQLMGSQRDPFTDSLAAGSTWDDGYRSSLKVLSAFKGAAAASPFASHRDVPHASRVTENACQMY